MDSIELQNNIKIFENNLKSLDEDYILAERQSVENINVVAAELKTQEEKLQAQYAKLDREAAAQLEDRYKFIESSIAKAKKSIKTVLDQQPKADAKTMYQTMVQVWTKDIPLYDIQTATVYSVELQKLYDNFQTLFVKLSNLQRKAGSDESFVTGSENILKLNPTSEDQLVHAMRNIMAEFSIRLGLLEKEILQFATTSIAKYKAIKRNLLEKDTIIPSLRASLQTLQKAERDRQDTVFQTQNAYKEQYAIFKQKFAKAQEQMSQQQKLVEASRQQPVVVKPRASISRSFPSPLSDTFTQDMTLKFQKYAMSQTDVSQGSQCSVDGATQPPKNYQELLSDLMEPDLPYRGFLANYGTGSGKTRLSALTIEKWFLRKLMMNNSYGSPVLVLLPNTNLISSWRKEMKQWLTTFEVADAIQSLNTTVLSVNKPNEPSKKGYIILHKITVVLPPPVKSLMMKMMSAGETMISNQDYVLSPIDYNHPCYSSLSSSSKKLLSSALAAQQNEVRRRETAVTSQSLIIGDESHNWINPQEIARDVTASTTVLAWANTIKSAKGIKVLELTATPLLDDAKLSDLIKGLNLVLTNSESLTQKPMFEGIWRRGLASADSDEYKNAVVLADEAESNYIAKQLFDVSGTWLPGVKRSFQKMYGPAFSYITLSNDPTVYPSFTKDCGVSKDTCTYQWNPVTQELDPVSEEQLQELELPKPSEGRNILVPMAFTQYQKLASDMNTDLGNWSLTRRLDADPAKPSMADINYSAKSTKSSVLGSRGMKVYTEKGVMEWSPKADVLFHLMKQYANDKFFAFTSSNDQIFAKTMTSYIQKVTDYEVFDIVKAASFLKSQGPKTTMKDLVQSFYTRNSAKRRVILFVASATVVKEIGPTLMDKVKEFMVELFNESEKNLNGEYFQLFLGDRNTKEGINLFHTMHAVLLDVSASKTMWLQSKARVLRYCSHRKMPIEKWSQVILWTMINLPSILKGKVRKVRAAAKKRRGGADSEAENPANPFANYVYPDSAPLALKPLGEPLIEPLGAPLIQPLGAPLSQPLGAPLIQPFSRTPLPKPTDVNRKRTNEEYQAIYLAEHEAPSIKVVAALIEGSFTCPLFRPYNQEPKACLDEVVAVGSVSSKPGYTKSSRYCVNLGLITVQLENSETLIEVAENLVNMQTPAPSFEYRCKTDINQMNPPSYRDTLVLRKLLTPVYSPASEKQLDLFTEILDELNEEGPFKLSDDLALWNTVSKLDDKHKEALLEIERKRQLLVSEDNAITFTSLVNQFESWLKMKDNATAVFDQWMRFLRTKPTLLVVSRSSS